MTENKRFTIIHIGNPYECVIKDHNTKNTIGMFDSTTDPVNEVVDLLNVLHEENEALKLDNKLLLGQIKEIRDKLTVYLQVKGIE